jgi:DNA-binding IclR family transcriptional regulator
VDECLTSRDLARRAQIPKSSGHRIVSTLEEIGALARGPQGYQPGFLLAALALSVDVNQALRCLCRDLLEEMAFRLRVRLEISVLQDGLVHCIARANAPGEPSRGHPADAHLDPFGSTPGRILLAGLAADRLERLLLANRQAAPRWPGLHPEQIRQELAAVRAQGFATGNGRAKDQWCVAVPVSDRSGRVIAALAAQCDTGQALLSAMDDIRMQLLVSADVMRARINPVERPEEDQN